MKGLFFPDRFKKEWRAQLLPEMKKEYFQKLSRFLESELVKNQEIYPKTQDILRVFYETDLPEIKVVILGQDPYHGPKQAIGRAFAVPTSTTPKPPSLKNIFKEIESDLDSKVDPQSSELDQWVKEGVFLLNTVLSVRPKQAFSHRYQGWETFTDRVIQILNERKTGLVFMLWGAAARKKASQIDTSRHFVLEAPHPSPLSAHRGFLGCRHFSKANEILEKQLSKAPINWTP